MPFPGGTGKPVPEPANVAAAAHMLMAMCHGNLDHAIERAGEILAFSINPAFAAAVLAELRLTRSGRANA